MSVSRISLVKFKSKEACDEMVESYTSNAPSEFPEAEQLLHIRIDDDNTSIAVSLYKDKEAMERASAARDIRMGAREDQYVSVETHVGEVKLNLKN